MSILLKRKKLRREEVVEHGSWAISYGDLVTVLLCFFIIFFSTDFKSKDREKLDNSLVDSINGTFVTSSPMSDYDMDSDIKIKKINKDNFLVFFRNISFFNSGIVEPNSSFHMKMKKFVRKINPFLGDYKLVIHAYTDSNPVTSTNRFKDNVELSGLRAISVKTELEKLGIDSNRMEISGKGILSESVLKFMGIPLADKSKVREVQRTVAFVVRRDSVTGESYEN